MKSFLLIIAALAVATAAMAQEMSITGAQAAFFEARIRPVLVGKCYSCHSSGADKVGGELLLDTREGMRRGGASGPAVVPGDLMASLVISAIRWHDPARGMPPQSKGGRLPSAVISAFEQWVIMGAPDPRVGPIAPGQIIHASKTKSPRTPQAVPETVLPPPRLPALSPASSRQPALAPLSPGQSSFFPPSRQGLRR